MIDDVLAIPDQLRDALWRVESARLEAATSAGLFVCGMGGSAIGGDLAAAALGDRLTGPMATVRGYALPSWATPEWTVLCSSYSGNTEETLACFEAAEALGANRLVASIGGQLVDRARDTGVPVVGLPGIFQPRAAVAYMVVVAAEAAYLAGVAPRVHTEVDAAAAFLSRADRDLAAAGARDRRAHRRRRAGDLRLRPDRAGGAALEDAGQRERQAPRLVGRAAGGQPQRAARLVGLGRGRAPGGDLPRGPRPAPAGRAPLRADGEGGRAERRRGGAGRDGGGDADRAADVGGDAGRPGLAWSWPASAASTPARSRRSSASRRRWDEGDGPRGGPGDAVAADHLRHAEADGPGPEPPGDGAHPAAAGQAWLRADDRQPLLVPGPDRRATSATARAAASRSATAARRRCWGPRAGCATRPISSATTSSSSPATP